MEAWDDEDRLLTWSGGGKNDQFYYNGLGLRMDKEDSLGTHGVPTDGASPASSILYDNNNGSPLVFTPGLSQKQNGASTYYHADALGSVRGMTDGGGYTTDVALFSAFGETVSHTGTTQTEAQFGGTSGYRTDADSHLMLLGHRYYNPATGRFLSQDPAGSGSNWYDYAGNNPLSNIDPSGLTCSKFDSTGMDFGQIYDYVTSHGGEVGETYQTVDPNSPNSKAIFTFTVCGVSLGTQSAVAPYGFNINQDISAARSFYNSRDSFSRNGKHDPAKLAAYLIDHYHPHEKHGDPKQYGNQYDKYGHVIYAAAASELRIKLITIVEGEQDVHDMVHPLDAFNPFYPGENSVGEVLGWEYDQHFFHPGPGIYDSSDLSMHMFGN